MTGLQGQLANEPIADYKKRFQAQLALIEAEEQRQLAAKAAQLQADEAAEAEKLRLQAEADANAQARRKEAQDLLQRHEATSIDRLKFWHFEPNGDEGTPEEQHKEFLSKLMTLLLYTCNYQQSELEKQYRDLTQQHQELATLHRTVQGHEDATRALNARLLDLEQAVPGPAAGASSSAPSSRQLEERVNHVVAMLGDISTFAVPTTISSQLHTLKTEVQQLQSTNADGNPKLYKMPTFQLDKFDDYTQQDPVLWWEAFTTQLRILPVAKHAYIGALFMNSKGGCQTWLTHLATSHGVDVPDLKDKITWEELTRLWKKRFIVDDAPTLAINRLFTMSQGNTATRDSLTEWQKIAVVPNLDLPFTHLRLQPDSGDNPAATPASDDGDQVAVVEPRSNESRNNGKAKQASQTGNGQLPWVKFGLTEAEYKVRGRYGSCYWCNNTKHKTSLCQDQGKEDVRPRLSSGNRAPRKVVDLHAYIAKIDREFKTQRYDDIDAPLLYVRIQIGEATCNALIDCGASRNYISEDFMVRAGLGPRVRRKSQPTQVTLADGHTHESIDRCIDAVPVYFAPHASEAVSFDILDTKFDMILGMSWLRSENHPSNLDEHVKHLRTVLERLRQAKYKANRDKCEFAQQELEYLGHYVTPKGIRPLADKIEALRVWPEPTNTTDVRSFMGLAGYYQRFITGYSRIVAPMTRLQSPKVPFVFDDDARRSFQALKTTMLMAPVLSIYDPTLPTRVTTDASGFGIGAVLEQHDGDDWHPMEYFSHKVPPTNSLDDARKKELLAFVMALKRWRHFVLGHRRFTWVTDNNPLTYYKTQDTVSSTIRRWMYFIDQFDFTPKHLPDRSNRAADALSRRPDLCAMTHHAFTFDEELQRHFIRAYQFDPDFATLYAQLSSDHPPASHYRIVDGYLLLHSRGKDLLCVPRDSRPRTRLLREYHDSRLAGHFGVNRTIARLRQRFRWPDLITDVTRYCDSCEVCRRSKPHNRNPYGELHPTPIPREPGLSSAMDVTGPFPRDRLGHDGILAVVDRLSKYACFLPCKYYSTAPELARLLHTDWICGHGAPEDIVSDRDTRFMSAFWTALMQESGTTMKPSSARHPHIDRQTERAHQTAQMMLRTLIRPNQKDWVDRLPDIEFAYNTSVHPTIGVTPFELHHGGRKGRIFAGLLLPRPADIDAACSPTSVRKYRELLTQARANMQKAQVRMQQQANRRRIPCPIRAGDQVWVSAEEFALEQDVSRKLLPKWFGPWSVTAAAGDEPDGPSFVINIPEHLTVQSSTPRSWQHTRQPRATTFRADDRRTLLLWMVIRKLTASSPIASTAASRGSTKSHSKHAIVTTLGRFQAQI
ncbi:hypothetical protein CBR_g28911 [Chara braunii]|uniref:Integrase catalytic domain-containing protein n=1 Tax=Chara braunii TaxID=69332 RepID=A0A388LA82_CHABU|nr:hypothetical protein CBR_g28911 [Chara braunii]|eukprot:GBG79194.1 hypothetical protein CBR_g28911 [Chara braunii]